MSSSPENYFSVTAEEYAEAYSMENMTPEFIEVLDRFVEKMNGGKVLDAGCGFGKDTEYFHENGLKAVGVDLAEGMIKYARENGNAEYQLMNVKELEFNDGSFDAVWCNTVMQFFPPEEMIEALEELQRVLKPGGILYTTFKEGEDYVIRQENEFSEEDELKRYRIPEEKAREILEKQGHEILELEKTQLNDMTVMNIFCRKD